MTLLSALRVVDLTSQIAGPYATKLLADAGADVIKVEGPDGDPLRSWTASATDTAGVPAGPVTGPAALLANPQLVARGFIESVDSPTMGHHKLFGLPFRLASRPGPWLTRPAPALGQDSQNILQTLLGLSEAEISELRRQKITGDRPGGA